jgi:intein/homing endonuclease/predicted kinase
MNVLKFQQYIKEEYSKNDPIPELNSKDKLCIILMGAPATGKCLEYNTPIFINNNIEKIGDIIEKEIPKDVNGNISIPVKDFYINSISDDNKIVKNEVSSFYRGYSEKLLEIKTQCGINVKVTPEHPLFVSTLEGNTLWKMSKDLLLTDKISKPRQILYEDLESNISIEMSRIIGYALSDGDFYKKGEKSLYFNLTNIDKDIIDDFKYCIEKESNGILTIKSKGSRNQVQYKDIQKGLRRFNKYKFSFIENIINICGDYVLNKKSHFVYIPKTIFNNDILLKNFLACYFVCDGCFYRNNVDYYTTSYKMACDISYSLLKFGINSRILNKTTKLNNKEFKSFIIRISNDDLNLFADNFNSLISCERKLIKKIEIINSNMGSFIISNEFISLVKREKLIKKIKNDIGYKISENLKYRRPISKNRLDKIIEYLKLNNIESDYIDKYKNLHNNLFFDKIISIEIIEHNDYVYDLVLNKYHNFIGGNIPTILHNSTFIGNYIRTKQDIKVFSTDDVSLKITKDPNIYHPNSSSLNIKMIFNFIKTGQSFIYDTTGTHRETITKIVDESSSKDYKIVFIHLVSTLNNSLERNKLRDRTVDEDYLKMSYSTQFKNISYYANLTNNSYYIVSTLDNKYVFYKYQNGKIVKRNNDRYV